MNNIQTRTTVNKTATERKIDKENTNSHAEYTNIDTKKQRDRKTDIYGRK